MKNVRITSVFTLLVLTGCSGLPPEYDGNVGYRILKETPTRIELENTLEDMFTTKQEETQQMFRVCTHLFKTDASNVRVFKDTSNVFSKKLNVSIPVPTGNAVSRHDGKIMFTSKAAVIDNSAEKGNSSYTRDMVLRKTKFVCRHKES